MSKFWFYLTTLGDSALSVFGIRGGYEQPRYRVLQTIPPAIEIRQYDARVAAETPVASANDGAAFERLFRYITGANTTGALVPMTAPVAESSRMIAMTVPNVLVIPSIVEQSDMAALMPRRVALSAANRYRLKLFEPPYDSGPVPVSMIWHATQGAEPGNNWLRNLFRDVAEAI